MRDAEKQFIKLHVQFLFTGEERGANRMRLSFRSAKPLKSFSESYIDRELF